MTDRVVVITPAHDEAERLPDLVEHMAAQTHRPVAWVIVDDASTDDTHAVAEALTAGMDQVRVLRRHRAPGRSFDAKVNAFRFGYDSVTEDHDFVAVLDADVRLPSHYYETVLTHFADRPRCGVAGGRYRTPDGRLGRAGGSSVPGPAQVYRRQAFADIGGFEALPNGGEDTLSVFRARMLGWESACLRDLIYEHGRRMGGGGGRSALKASFEFGRRDWALGNLFGFEAIKLLRLLGEPPIVLSSLVRGAGFVGGALSGQRQIDGPTLEFVQSEQRETLRAGLSRLLTRSPGRDGAIPTEEGSTV